MYNKLTYNQIYLQQSIVRLFVALIFGLVWFGPLVTYAANLEGVLYTDAGITAGTSGKTVKAAVGASATVYSTTTTSGGAWSFTAIDFTNVSTTTPITVWLDGDTDDATTLVSGYSGSNITGTPLYYGHVVTYGTSSVAEVQMESFYYDSRIDSDILYTNQERVFEIASGTDLIIEQGILVAPQELVVAGNFQNNDIFNSSENVLTLTGVGKFLSGSLVGSSYLSNVKIEGSYTILDNASTTNFTIKDGGTLTSSSSLTVSGRFVNFGTYDGEGGSLRMEENSQTPFIYQAGRDVSGNEDGVGSEPVYTSVMSGNYLYISTDENFTACAQTAGDAIGCEIQVYDMSDPANPTYVAGQDASGSAAGTAGVVQLEALAVSGNYLFVGNAGYPSACSQTAGSATGCELQVYDVSNPTNPIYRAGRDSSGNADGTGSVGIDDMVIAGNYLYAVKTGSVTACSQTAGSAVGCELMVFDISSTTNPIYVAGLDTAGSNTGTTSVSMNSLSIHGSYLYVAKSNNGTACSQTAGSAVGCELMVFDISSSTNPIYVAGRDVTGDTSGTGSVVINDIEVQGNYLYIVKSGSATACSQTAGSAVGCELMVFDISSSTNPIYVAGQDSAGDAGGTGNVAINNLRIHGNYLYIGKGSSATACSQTAGSAIGCEIMVFDISSSTNPIYVAGQDSTGDTAGTGATIVYSLEVHGGYLYLVKSSNGAACSQTAGSAGGCEIMVFNATHSFFGGEVSGILVGSSTLGDVFTGGDVQIVDMASTTNLNIVSGSLTAPSALTVERDFTNGGTFTHNGGELLVTDTNKPQGFSGVDVSGSINGTSTVNAMTEVVVGNYLFVGTNGNATACSQTAGSAIGCELQVYDITNPLSPIYVAGRDIDGSLTGASTLTTYTLEVVGNYLYLGKAGNSTACSQTAGSAIGCELMVFDISSSTNPIYVAGRDVSGSAAGTGNSAIIKLLVVDGYLYIGKQNSSTACSQTAGSAIGCELMVFDISSSTNPIYVAGRDASGSAAGTGNVSMYGLVSVLGHLYVTKVGDSTACSQTAGSAIGCELMVFDISSSTNPIYVAGRDVSGSAAGAVNVTGYDITAANNHVYIGKSGNGTACSQVVGSATGCELMVFDVSSSTNPVYVAGRDVSGSLDGTTNLLIYKVKAEDGYLYVGNGGSVTACSQVAGSATGCEIQAFDISDPGSPVYAAGRDASGSATGTGSVLINTLTTIDNYLYVGKSGNGTACSQIAGSAIGCEVSVFEGLRSRQFVAGNLIGSSALGNITTYGEVVFVDVASTTNMSIVSGEVYMPELLTVNGDYTNGATAYFDAASKLLFAGTGSQTIGGNLTATSSLPHVYFSDAGIKTISANASTSDFSIATSSDVVTEGMLSVDGDYINAGDFTAGAGIKVYGDYVNTGTSNLGGNSLAMVSVLDYISGIDAGGLLAGTSSTAINAFVINGNYLYVGMNGNATACSQIAGSATGCELMVFDISSSTNPTYVAGRDVSGSAAGTGNVVIYSLAVVGTSLYMGKVGNTTACSQTAGSATGCELMVFDISSSTNPTYVAGRDASGDASGISSADINTLANSGSYLYLGKGPSSTACSQTAGSAIGCELMVFDISSSTNPIYVAGLDGSGSAAGTSPITVMEIAVAGNYLYAGKSLSATACSQTAGSAIGCELMVFDISSSTNPTYVAGLDSSGSAAGSGTVNVFSVAVAGNYLYIGKSGNGTACSQTAGSATGCELMVFSISSSTNPTYVAGRDVSGSAAGSGSVDTNSLFARDNYLYVGKASDATACSQTAGSAIGCELMVFDISSSTNPVYVTGRDASSDAEGIGAAAVNTITISGDYFYAGKSLNSTACSQTAGSAIGCELMVFDSGIKFAGNLTGVSSLGNLTTIGRITFENNASTTNFTVEQGSVSAPAVFTVAGNYQNNSAFNNNSGEVILTGSGKTMAGNLTGDNAFNTLMVTGSYTVASSTASTTSLTIASGGSLTAPSALTIEGDYNNAGTFTHSSGEVIIDNNATDVLSFMSGLDIAGVATGTGSAGFYTIAHKGNYVFTGSTVGAQACVQTAPANGCELRVFDISSSTNPVYVAGRDSDGSATGVTSLAIYHLVISGDYLFLARNDDATACSQTAGSAIGCEIQIYDISDPTNPTYVAGLDADGTETGTSSIVVQWLAVKGNYLYAARNANTTACSQTLPATGCELLVFDVTDPANPVYVAGRNSDGSTGGTASVNTLFVGVSEDGQYLHVAKAGNIGTCSNTIGSANGCEIMVFDISSSTNPTYVAGRDTGGNQGSDSKTTQIIINRGDYLYVASNGNTTACSQTAGSAVGCELQVFDVSTPTNPIYIAGRDMDGGATGVIDSNVNYIEFIDGYLFVGKELSTSTCTQTIGNAAGCELLIFDVADPSNPTMVEAYETTLGQSGGEGITNSGIFSIVHDEVRDMIYLAKTGNGTACAQVAGGAHGCELIVVKNNNSRLAGNLSGTSGLNDLTVLNGRAYMDSATASTTDILVASAGTLIPADVTTVGSSITNNGVFGPGSSEVVLLGSNHTLTGTTTFHRLTKVATGAAVTTFEAGALYTINENWTFGGNLSSPHQLRSSNPGEYWYVDPQGEVAVSYLDVEDSNNVNVSTVYCTTGCIEGTNNVNWAFELPAVLTLSSEADYHFYAGAATTTLPTINLADSATPAITTANDIRISIATTSTNFSFDTTNTTLSFTGSAAAKVSSTVSYEDAGATLVIAVTSNFAAEDTLAIAGIEVGSFATVTAATSSLALYIGGDVDGTPDALDDKIIHLTGSLLLDEHALGQVANEFSFANKTDQAFFAFNLTGVGEVMTVTDTVLTLSGIQGVTESKLSGFRLYRDINSNGALDGGDVQIDGAGILTINGQHGAVTFSTDFVASTSANYIVVGSTSGIQVGDSVVFSLESTGLTATGNISSYLPYVVHTVETIQHTRAGAGGGGSHTDRIGGAPPAGDGDVGGGGSDGGSGTGEEVDGANIATDPNYVKPSATGDVHNEWTNGANAYDSDGIYATAASTNLRQTYNGFAFGIPDGNTIQGVDVKIDASGTTAAGTIDVALSWDGGASFTSAKATPTVTGTDVVYTVGGPADTWGRAWSATEFSTTNFRLRVTAQTSANTLRLDALQIQVYHQAGGGGSGGGGGI